MIQVAKHSVWPIGCDIDRDVVRLAQVSAPSGGVQSLHTAVAPVNDRMTAADAVVEAVGVDGFVGRDLVLTCPPDLLHYRAMQIVSMPEAELKAAAHWQFCREMNLNPDLVVSDYFIVGKTTVEDKLHFELIGFGVDNQTIKPWIDEFESHGLVPVGIDLPSAVIARFALNRLAMSGDSSHNLLVIDTINTATGIVLVVDGEIRFTRSIRTLRQPLEQQFAQILNVDRTLAGKAIEQVHGDKPWTIQAIERESARSALANIERQLSQNLIREATMCLQHVKRLDRNIVPTHLYVRSRQLSAEATSSIAAGLNMIAGDWSLQPGDGLEPVNDSGVTRLDGGEWAMAMGLALYGPPSEQSWKDAA